MNVAWPAFAEIDGVCLKHRLEIGPGAEGAKLLASQLAGRVEEQR